MIKVFYQNNLLARKAVQTEAKKFVANTQGEVFSFEEADFNKVSFDELANLQNLFGEPNAVILYGFLSDADNRKIFEKNSELLKSSSNLFCFAEESILATFLTKLQKLKVEVEEFGTKGDGKPKVDFNIFSLGDALGKRDKKELWLKLMQAYKNNVSAEEIAGTLFWQIKSMIIALNYSASQSGLNPFVFSKSSSYSKNFSAEELKNLAGSIVKIYHQARMGKIEMENGLERLVLLL